MGFVVTWTPYTLILIYNSFLKEQDESLPLMSDISAVIAKSSVIWSTLLYMFTNSNIKSKLNISLFKWNVEEHNEVVLLNNYRS